METIAPEKRQASRSDGETCGRPRPRCFWVLGGRGGADPRGPGSSGGGWVTGKNRPQHGGGRPDNDAVVRASGLRCA